MNKLGLYFILGIICYLTYVIGGEANAYHKTQQKEDYDKIIKVNTKEISIERNSKLYIITDQGEFECKDMEMYLTMNQHCTYKIWTTDKTITKIDHVIEDGCQRYYPDSLHKI